jgi:hypothetical protein
MSERGLLLYVLPVLHVRPGSLLLRRNVWVMFEEMGIITFI